MDRAQQHAAIAGAGGAMKNPKEKHIMINWRAWAWRWCCQSAHRRGPGAGRDPVDHEQPAVGQRGRSHRAERGVDGGAGGICNPGATAHCDRPAGRGQRARTPIGRVQPRQSALGECGPGGRTDAPGAQPQAGRDLPCTTRRQGTADHCRHRRSRPAATVAAAPVGAAPSGNFAPRRIASSRHCARSTSAVVPTARAA